MYLLIRCAKTRLIPFLGALLPLVLCLPAAAQQDYVGRYDAYAGFTYFSSGNINLAERGFHLQVGINPTRWYALGFDYSVSSGHTSLIPKMLTDDLQELLQMQRERLAGRLPPGYSLTVPVDSETQTFAAGPQFVYRRFRQVTFFIRPSVGAIREIATPKPQDPIAAAVVAQLAPSGEKQDWTAFYGVGGGVDLNFTRHVSLRLQGDFVHDHLFNDVLKGRNTFRFAAGPAFHFGRNVQ